MKKRLLLIMIGALLFCSLLFLIWDKFTSGNRQNIGNKAAEYEIELKRVSENSQLKDDKQITERNPYEHKHEEEVIYPEDDITYMFTAAKANDVEGFYDSFTAEALIVAFPEVKEMRVQMEEYLDILTQSGNLKDIGILSKKVTNPDPKSMEVVVSVALLYDGLNRKEVEIKVQSFADEHGGRSWKTVTPMTEIISQIQ
ncbi:hypothetical protein [Brevibacillus reuszeri]|uniref:hypothetical protein n=1 Tax=Brevibacillus reuszeri TaxID=54915 RepID=UPI000CCC4E6C|nr:hypothetical protein [Brevibacillus reuszeri]